ncbi:uncharacterized protein LOC128951570 [Oppia nitens]|uniref:uncharacterized protein LOC128951570 n=1 Tax=Oppia nitens TaxID=1686743 RepID=UPI0023DB800B|nr:uncharacterized protein LOC128951570 [Oppia nitens]
MTSNFGWENNEKKTSDEPEKIEIKKLPPEKLLEYERKSETAIFKQTLVFGIHFKQCEEIVEAAYRVADYVPDKLTTINGKANDEKDIWNDTIIPILVDTLKQDVEFRGVVTECFAAVRSLTITIQKAYDIVNDSQGSSIAIKIAKKNIPKALERLDSCIEKAMQLDASAVTKFGEQIKTILNIIGPEAAKFMEEIVNLQTEINKCYEERDKLLDTVAELKGQCEQCKQLIDATNNYLKSLHTEVESIDILNKQMEQTKLDVLDVIKNIPDRVKVPKQQSKSFKIFSFTLWEENFGSIKYFEDYNPHKESESKHYENLIRMHAEQIMANDDKNKSKKDLIMQLENQKSNYIKELNEISQKLVAQDLQKRIENIDKKIEKLSKQIETYDNNAKIISDKYKLPNNKLLECLINVRLFAKTIKPGASAYSPLCAILIDIKSIVETYVDYLSLGEKKSEIFMAGQYLMRQVEFLSNYNSLAIDIFVSSEQYNDFIKKLNTTVTTMAIDY